MNNKYHLPRAYLVNQDPRNGRSSRACDGPAAHQKEIQRRGVLQLKRSCCELTVHLISLRANGGVPFLEAVCSNSGSNA